MKTKLRSPHNWLEEHDQYLRDNIEGTPRKKMVEMINNEFNLDLSFGQVKTRLNKLELRNNIDMTFQTGIIPFTKGKTWDDFMSEAAQEKSRKTTFKKGNRPLNWKPVGSERVDVKDGYVLVKTEEPNIWRPKHYVEWEKVNGKVPEGKRFIFLDGDRTNCSPENLILVDYGIGAIMNNQGLYTEGSVELQEVGIATAELISKISNLGKDLE